MGIKHSWIAIRGLKPEDALAALGMEVSELLEPHYLADGIGMAQLPADWLLFVSDRKANAFEGKLVGLAAFGPAVGCDISEIVMASEARGYEAGVEVWRVAYDCAKGFYELEVRGSPPPQLDTIHRTLRAQQEAEGGEEAGVDLMFDTPAKLAQSICGFMLGESESKDFRYSELQPIGGWPVRKPGFFARLFGRG